MTLQDVNQELDKYYCNLCKKELYSEIETKCNNCDTHYCGACRSSRSVDMLGLCDFCNNRVCVRCLYYRGKKQSCKRCCKIAMIPKGKDKIILGKCADCLKSSLEIYISKCDDCSKNICISCAICSSQKYLCTDCNDCQDKYFGLEIQKMFAEKMMPLLKIDTIDICVICCKDATVTCSCGNETNRCITCIANCTLCGKMVCKSCFTSHSACLYAFNETSSAMTLKNKIVVITGKLSSMKRKHAESLVITSGGDVGSTVSRNTDFVVAGENPGSKLDRAQELGIPIFTEKEFLAMVDHKPITTVLVKKKEPTKKRRIIL